MQFPKDELNHRCNIEWWYFNGNLFDKNRNRYAFMNCLFKANPKKSDISLVKRIPKKEVFFSHSLFVDVSKKRKIMNLSPFSILSGDSFKREALFVNYLNSPLRYINNEIFEFDSFKYRLKNENLDLVLKARKEPLLHNGGGDFVVDGKKVFYYSLTNLDAKGVVVDGNKVIEVCGKAWMDHEWSNFIGRKKWEWFSIQLNNGIEIMIQRYNNGENNYVGIIYGNGKADFVNDLILVEGKKWKSKISGAEYPVSWKVIVKSKKIELEIKAVLSDMEVLFGSLNYWEGPVDVMGKIDGKNIRGIGFMELVGKGMKNKFDVYNYQIKQVVNSYFKIVGKKGNYLLNGLINKI
ncbi:MAG: hypothetical protein N3D20_01525 [Candidatus Pacearchaeota archaeon]|nr:hypothetical protein [Candidatus Pacearchaeota archaeon]